MKNACLCVLSQFNLQGLSVTLWTVAHQAPLSTGFSRQSRLGCHVLLQGIFLTQELNQGLVQLLHYSEFFTAEPPGKPATSKYIPLNAATKFTLRQCIPCLAFTFACPQPTIHTPWSHGIIPFRSCTIPCHMNYYMD